MYLGDDAYEKDVGGASVKVRDPWRVGVLELVTLGIYGYVWFYLVNRELRDFAPAKGYQGVGFNPVLALLLVTVAVVLLIPALAGWIHFFARIRRAQRADGADHALSWWAIAFLSLVALLWPIGGLLFFEYLQFHLNSVWKARPGDAPRRVGAAEPAAA